MSKSHGCEVAIKIVSKFNASSEYLKKFFPREVEVVKNLNHPHLIKYFAAIETTHRIYIIMEYAPGGTLFEYIQKNNYVDENQSRKWFLQLISVVKYCHKNKIVHRDIKCENILLDENENIRLLDFGFARKMIPPDNSVVLLSNTFCGSYAYLAPEILKGRSYNPFISDIWSMGVVLYAMVNGCLPFNDENYFILLKQVRSEVKFPEEPHISVECHDLIIRILKPAKNRPSLADIKTDKWFTMSNDDPISSEFMDNIKSENENILHIRSDNVSFVTKETLIQETVQGTSNTFVRTDDLSHTNTSDKIDQQ